MSHRPQGKERARLDARRFAALILAAVLCTSLLPPRARAAEGDSLGWTDIGKAADPVSAGTAAENTYIFEVSTGSRRNGDAVDNILYFAIAYTTTDGKARSILLFPGIDGLEKGFDIASKVGNCDARRKLVKDKLGYTTEELNKRKALGSVSTDQLLFTTPAPVKSIDKIQIFGKATKSASDWACQGMRFYRVDTLYGLDMVGWYSADGYIDFDGEVIAEAVMTGGAGTFRWNNSGGTFNIAASGGTAGVTLSNSGGNVGKKHDGHAKENNFVFRMDFADEAGAGFESLSWLQELGKDTKISSLKLCECAALVVRYKDVYGTTRQAELPMILSALGQILENKNMGDVSLAGFAQQGDSVAFTAKLPDFAELVSINLALGAENACSAAGLKPDSDKVRASRAEKSKTDDITYLCFAVYRDVYAAAALDGATLRCKYEAGPQNPVQYSVASTSGVQCAANQTKQLSLQNWHKEVNLTPVDRHEKYLVTLSTDNVANAGTASDILLKFKYVSMENKELESADYNIRDYIRSFYGDWPGSTDEFAYKYGLRDGGTVRFMIPLDKVKEFTKVSVQLKGGDEWQFSGLNIALVKSYSARVIEWADISEGGLSSYVRFDRRVETQPVSFRVGDVPEDGEKKPDPTDENWQPGILIQDDDRHHDIDPDEISEDVSKKDDVNWSELRHYMTYQDTQQDLGFTKERCVYTVSVYVAGDKVNADDDDCGSKNLFYFRLLFENGNSGCTQANQQIVGDAFRTGMMVSFKIPTTQDYGELTAVQVIPDAQDGKGDIYDKLKIEKIEVVRDSSSALSPTWVAASESEDGLGWVGIDYRDPGEIVSSRGAEGRSVSELATTYPITGSRYSAKLLISITTGSYEENTLHDKEGKLYTVQDKILTGGLSANFNYFNNEGRLVSMGPIDLVEAMNSYANRTGTKIRNVQFDDGTSETQAMDFYVSDPNYQFRPGKTDSFVLTVSDIRELTDVELLVRSSVVTKWNITDINVYLINGESSIRYLNAKGEYDYRYPKGKEPAFITSWAIEDPLSTQITVYRKEQNDSIIGINIPFESNPIKLSADASKWVSTIARVPKSKDDTVNLYLYPAAGSGNTDPSSYEVSATIRYTNASTKTTTPVSTGPMLRTTDANGRTVFCATGVSVPYMEGLAGIDVEGSSLRSISAPISYGLLERVRSGVLIENHRLTGIADAGLGGTMGISSVDSANRVQRLLLQVSESAQAQTLKAEVNDLAVALYFISATPSGQELRSKYIYLTDQGVTEIRPGQLVEADFCLGDVSEITGVNLVSMGTLNLSFTGAFVADQVTDGAVVRKWSLRDALTPSTRSTRYPVTEDASEILTLALTTAEDVASSFSGTKGPVRLSVGYYTPFGSLRTETYENIRPYIADGKGFASGGTDTIRLLLPEYEELRWVELEPLSENAGTDRASWKLAQLTAIAGLDGSPITKTLNQVIQEGEPLHVGLAKVLIAGTYTVEYAAPVSAAPEENTETEDETTPAVETTSEKKSLFTGESASELVKSNGGVDVAVQVSGSAEGFTATLMSYNPTTGATGRASLDPTHGFTAARLAEIKASAQKILGIEEPAEEESSENASAEGEKIEYTEEERAAARKLLDCVAELEKPSGEFTLKEEGVVFRAPRNYTGGVTHYRIVLAAKEAPDAAITIDITVESEKEPLTEALSTLENAQNRAMMQRQADAAAEAAAAAAEAAAAAAEASKTPAAEWGGGENGGGNG